VDKHPVKHGNLGERGDDGGDNLHAEQDARRDLHVVAKLQVGCELDTLGRGNVAVGNKDHVSDRTAREYGARDELADQVDAAVLVGDGHDDADGDEEHAANAEGQQQAVPWEVDRITEWSA